MPSRMMPVYPDDASVRPLLDLAHRVFISDAKICCLPIETQRAIATVVSAMEAQKSSQIEGYQGSLEDAFCADAGNDTFDAQITGALYLAMMDLEDFRSSTGLSAYHPESIQFAHRALFRDELDSQDISPGQYRQQLVTVQRHVAVEAEAVDLMIRRIGEFENRKRQPAEQLISMLALHHRFVWVHPFSDGNGRVARMILREAMKDIDISSLWSLSKALETQKSEYFAAIQAADQGRMGDYDGRGNLSQKRLVDFIGFMLQVCVREIEEAKFLLQHKRLSGIIDDFFMNKSLLPLGVSDDSHLAWKALFFQGTMARGDFKKLIPKGDRTSTAQISAMIASGMIESRTSKSDLRPLVPIALAKMIFP